MASPPEREGTLTDRFAVAFMSAIFAIVLGALVWVAILMIAPEFVGPALASFRWVIGFAVVMGVLGFLLLENLIAHVLGALLNLLKWAP